MTDITGLNQSNKINYKAILFYGTRPEKLYMHGLNWIYMMHLSFASRFYSTYTVMLGRKIFGSSKPKNVHSLENLK